MQLLYGLIIGPAMTIWVIFILAAWPSILVCCAIYDLLTWVGRKIVGHD